MNYICHKSIWTQGSDGRVLPLSRFAHNGHLRRGGQLDGLQGHRHHWHQADYLQTQFKVLVSKSYLIFFSFYIFLQIFRICSVYFNRFFFNILYILYIFYFSTSESSCRHNQRSESSTDHQVPLKFPQTLQKFSWYSDHWVFNFNIFFEIACLQYFLKFIFWPHFAADQRGGF